MYLVDIIVISLCMSVSVLIMLTHAWISTRPDYPVIAPYGTVIMMTVTAALLIDGAVNMFNPFASREVSFTLLGTVMFLIFLSLLTSNPQEPHVGSTLLLLWSLVSDLF